MSGDAKKDKVWALKRIVVVVELPKMYEDYL